MFSALAYVLMLVVHISLGFLTLDIKDFVIVTAGLILGPLASVIVSVVVSLAEMFTVSSTGIYGFIMNVVSTLSFALPATILYRKNHSLKGAVIGLIIGVITMTGMMLLWNYALTPLYMKVPRATVVAMLIPTFLPFNLVKGILNASITMLLYKRVINALRFTSLVNKPTESKPVENSLGENEVAEGETAEKKRCGKRLINIIVAVGALLLIVGCAIFVWLYF